MAAWMLVLQRSKSTGWMADYVANVPAIIKKYGGKYLGVSQEISNVENSLSEPNTPKPGLVAIFSFSAKERIEEFLSCTEYEPYLKMRKAGSDSDIFIMDTVQIEFPW